jgi:hypothetical protein
MPEKNKPFGDPVLRIPYSVFLPNTQYAILIRHEFQVIPSKL